MAQNIDDYYSSISSDPQSGNGNSASNKPIIKKKIKVKAKKAVQVEEVKETTPVNPPKEEIKKVMPPQTQETRKEAPIKSEQKPKVSQGPQTLNDALDSNKKSRLTIVSRGSEEKPKTQTRGSSGNSGNRTQNNPHQNSAQQNNASSSRTDSSGDTNSSGTKFKPGFSNANAKPGFKSQSNQEDTRGGKKSKFYGNNKGGRYRNKIDVDDSQFTRSNKLKTKKKEQKNIEDISQTLTARTGETVILPEFLSLKEFSEKIGVPLSGLIAEFMKNGMMMTINSQIDFDTATLISESFDVKLEKEASSGVAIDELASGNIKDFLAEDDASKLIERAPVVSIMGHVDHGKTSLLDYIRNAKVASGEAGGITQSIGAYQAEYNDRKITFLDTPGHEAFTIMRSRGAKSTDIAILVVAADEGVKPQTIESISHAKEAGIPVIVAINKMDKEGANPDFVKGQLAERGLTPEDWGGDTPMVPVSAQTGFGIDDLLEIILLSADILELKANPDRNGIATIIESYLDMQLGPVATVLVNTGTIEKGSAIVCGASYGKVKVLKDYTGKGVKLATPGMPVLVVGLDKVANGGDILQVVSGIDVARQKSVEYQEFLSNKKMLKTSQLDILMTRIKAGNLKHLKIVLKSDTNGSLEAIRNALEKLSTPETSVSIIHSGVGNITEGDVLMCGGSSAILIGFGVAVGVNARSTLEKSGVEYINSKIIYHITDRIEKIVSGMLDPKEVEVTLCMAKVGAIFYTSKKFIIVGAILTEEGSSIQNKAQVRVIRGDKVVGKGTIDSLKAGVEEVHKLEGPTECGLKIKGTINVEEKDVLEVYKIVIEK
ncbi:translation initiation factor IF-2 [Candidatus Gracilibacteria bacterium]|nr:translation initiation factor IF-2 [Candidatus Gracilibacteria bacterium]